MRYLELVLLSDIIFNLGGFQRYTKYAVDLVSKHNGLTPEDTVQTEKAYLTLDGSLLMQVINSNGDVLDTFTFAADQFRIAKKH